MNDGQAGAEDDRGQVPDDAVGIPSGTGTTISNEIVGLAAAALEEAGFPVRGRTFPYSMHHAFYRERVPRAANGRHRRHAEVAELLRRWAATRDRPGDYAWQAVEGAVRRMIVRDPGLAERIPRSVRDGMIDIGDGMSFLEWVRRSPTT